MKTQLKTEIRGVAVEMSIEEAKTFLKNPSRVQNEVRTMLRGGGVDIPDSPSKGEKEACPHCGKKFKILKIHLARGCPALKADYGENQN